MDPDGLFGVAKSDDSPAVRFWREKGGTPLAIPPEFAPIALTPEMRLWTRMDEELAGGHDESGYPRPEAISVVLDWYREPVQIWAESRYGGPVSEGLAARVARRMLRSIGAGRAEVRRENLDDVRDRSGSGESGNSIRS